MVRTWKIVKPRTRRVIKPPYTVASLMKRKQASKLIRYSKKNWLMSDHGLAGINLWIVIDEADRVEYYNEQWITRVTIFFTDAPIKLPDNSSGQFIVVWRWRRDLIAVVSAFKSFGQAKTFMDCAWNSAYWLRRHPEAFRVEVDCDCDDEDDCDCYEYAEIDISNTLSGAVESAFWCYKRK